MTAAGTLGGVAIDPEAEAAVVTAAMVDSRSIPQLQAILQPRMFHREDYAAIWTAVCDVAARREAVHTDSVARQMEQSGTLSLLELGRSTLREMVSTMPTAAGSEWWAEQVRSAWLARQYFSVAVQLQSAVGEAPAKAAEVADEYIAKLLRVGDMRRRGAVVSAQEYAQSHADEFVAFLEAPAAVQGIRSPWRDFDRATGGIRPTRLYVVLADTSVGKSLMVQNIALKAAQDGHGVLFFSGEMSAQEVFDRLIFMHAGIDPQMAVGRGVFTDDEKQDALASLSTLSELPFTVINDLSLPSIVSETRRLAASGRCDLVIIDHIQHVTAPDIDNKTALLEAAMQSLKRLALDEAVPVIAVSHVNRQTQANGMSTASGKGASAIEQDANTVISLTPGVFNGFWEPLTGEALEQHFATNNWVHIKVRLMKQRAGIRGALYLRQDWGKGGRYLEVLRGSD